MINGDCQLMILRSFVYVFFLNPHSTNSLDALIIKYHQHVSYLGPKSIDKLLIINLYTFFLPFYFLK